MPTPEPSPPPPILSRRALCLEFALVCALLWIPSLYSGTADYLGWKKPSILPADEIFSVYTALTVSLLPIFLIWRNGEPFAKLGLIPFDQRDIIVAFGLLLAVAAVKVVFLPVAMLLAAQPGAVTSTRVHHGFPLPVEAVVFLFAAFREEIFYRAYLCARLRDFGLNRTRTAIVSALMFASIHIYQGWLSLPTLFCFGLIFAGVFLRRRSLWPLFVAHACYNLILLAVAPLR
jgi:membrane protease YdiL (CAAX protease family)